MSNKITVIDIVANNKLRFKVLTQSNKELETSRQKKHTNLNWNSKIK